MQAKVNLQQLDLMKHAIGLERAKVKRGKYNAYRNYFSTHDKCSDYAEWEQLVKLELATKREPDKQGVIYYFVSEKGIELLARILEIRIVEGDW